MEEALFIPLALLTLGIPVCAVAGFFMALGQRRQSREFALQLVAFDRRLRAFEGRFGAAPEAPPIAESPFVTEAPQPLEPKEPTEEVAEPSLSVEPVSTEPPPLLDEPPTESAPPPSAAPPGPGLEETLGTRWAVWVGGVALALGGIFLVRYSIEQGLFGPTARVAMGVLFSLGLLAAGEWMRRHDGSTPSFGGIPPNHVPAVLTAAGTSTAFATVYAAYALYGMLSPAVAFVLLGAVSVLTMLGSALHGPALAALGLVAALGSPLLVETAKPNLWALVLYLAFVVLTSYGVARLRLWRWLALAGATGAILWSLLLLMGAGGDIVPVMLHVLVQTVLAGVFLVADPYRGIPDEEAAPDRFVNAVLLAFALAGLLVVASHFATARPGFAAILAVVLLALAVRYPAAAPSAVWATILTTGTLIVWPVAREVFAEPYTVVPDATNTAPRPEALQTYLTFAATLPALIAGASLWRLGRAPLPLLSAAFLCAAAALAPLSALIAAYWRVEHLERSVSFAIVASLVGLAFVAATAWLRRDERHETVTLAVGTTASAAIAAVAAGLTFALEQGMLTVAFALTALGTAWVADRVNIPILRYAVGGIAVVVLGRILWDPTIVRGPAGDTPIFNWFLWGYGVPALAFAAAARVIERGGRDNVVRLLESLAILFAALLAFLEIRHWIHGGDVYTGHTGHLEMGLLATTGLAFAIVMVRIEARRADPVYQVASLIFGMLSLLVSAFGLGIAENPLFNSEPITGGAVFNSLMPAYLLPAVIAGALAAFARRSRPEWYVNAAAALALGLQLLYTVLAIRRSFQGPLVDISQATSQAELWSYSIALLVIGLVMLAIGLVRDLPIARTISAGYMVAAVLKVFLIDLAHLEGLTRALSFIGLGLALVGIGLAYQKLLAGRTRLAPVPDQPGPSRL